MFPTSMLTTYCLAGSSWLSTLLPLHTGTTLPDMDKFAFRDPRQPQIKKVEARKTSGACDSFSTGLSAYVDPQADPGPRLVEMLAVPMPFWVDRDMQQSWSELTALCFMAHTFSCRLECLNLMELDVLSGFPEICLPYYVRILTT